MKAVDAKPLAVGVYSRDKRAAWGRGVRGSQKGYKLFCLWGEGAMPLAWAVGPMNRSEVAEAAALFDGLRGGGYVLGDRLYDCAPLYDLAMCRNHQLVAPRKRPEAGVSPRAASPHRLRAMDLLRVAFGQGLYAARTRIERRFGAMASFGGGLFTLPPWVRTLGRVQRYVHAKLLVNAARIRVHESAAA